MALLSNPFVGFLIAILLSLTVGLHGWSGKGNSPKFGDFEAQRHWMEITIHQPLSAWYSATPNHWPLDYPPLSGYHSWVFGRIASWLDPSWMSPITSQGNESPSLVIFMRLASILTQCVFYYPPLFLFAWTTFKDISIQTKFIAWSLISPPLLLIDHGHFQFNSAMLGLTLASVNALLTKKYGLAALAFTSALLFKQMSLFFALPIFFYSLGIVVVEKNLNLLIKLGVIVGTTTAALVYPVAPTWSHLNQLLSRVFPFHRGLFEDKVANVWCALNVLVKWRQVFTLQSLAYMSIFSTLLVILPGCYYVFKSPNRDTLLYSLLTSSLGFFLFSFQVHEKSILLPLLPATLLILNEPVWVPWFVNIATFSLYPLLKRDGQAIPYFATLLIWNIATRRTRHLISPPSLSRWIQISYAFIGTWHLLEPWLKPPAKYPDLYLVANVIFCCFFFSVFFVYFHDKLTNIPVNQVKRKTSK